MAFFLARASLCGKVPTKRGAVLYHLGYEPWNLRERARPDAPSWGRLFAAEIGFQPLSWLTLRAGIAKPSISFSHDEPEFSLALFSRSQAALALYPDRRIGLAIDAPLGAISASVGVYLGSRDAPLLHFSDGVIATGRLRIDPIGPTGTALSTGDDDPAWQSKFRFSVGGGGIYQYAHGAAGYAFSVNANAKWKPVGVALEYNNASHAISDLDGGIHSAQEFSLATAVMALRPYLECAARYEWYNETENSVAPAAKFHAVTFGLASYPFRHFLRAQVGYTLYLGSTKPADVVRIAVTFSQ